MILTEAEIDAAKSPKGGWTKKQLAAWGVSWPPPKGWKHRLLTGGTDHDPQTFLGGALSLSPGGMKAGSLPSFAVTDDKAMSALVHWLRRLDFDDTQATLQRDAVQLWIMRGDEAVGRVWCCDERARHAAENIAASIIIRREDARAI